MDITPTIKDNKMPDEIKEPADKKCYSIAEYLLWKLDRTLTVVALAVIASLAIMKGSPESWQVVAVIAGGFVGYVTGRTTNK